MPSSDLWSDKKMKRTLNAIIAATIVLRKVHIRDFAVRFGVNLILTIFHVGICYRDK
jgi:hypothetical protein